MPNLGGPELLIVLALAILLFGAKKLPDLGSSVGKSIKNFKSGIGEGKDDDVQTPDTVHQPDGSVVSRSDNGSTVSRSGQ